MSFARIKFARAMLVIIALVLATFSTAALAQNDKRADAYPSSVASAWFELLYDVVKAEKTTPPLASRIYGLTAIALYESIAPGTQTHRSLAGQLNDLTVLPRPPADALHWPAVANTAIAHTARGLYPTISPNTLGQINKLEQTLAAEFRGQVRSANDYERAAAHGRATSAAILSWASTDGFAAHDKCAYVAPLSEPGRWRPTPPSFMPAPLQPCWGRLRPMLLKSGQECAAPGPPKFSDNTASEFYVAASEVHRVGLGLTAEQKIIATYWADNAGDSGTPPGHWIDIVSQIARRDNLSLDKAAEAYMRVGIAVHDAFIGCWYTKYLHNLKRPVTYINDNLHGQWRSFVLTPPFPSYPSGHSVQSGAVARVMTDMFGARSFTDTTHADHSLKPALAPRSFKSFQHAAAEAAISRLYGGIHYAFDNNDGLTAGACIGQAILDRVKFVRGGM